MIRYDTIVEFDVGSKAKCVQLYLAHVTCIHCPLVSKGTGKKIIQPTLYGCSRLVGYVRFAVRNFSAILQGERDTHDG